MSSDNAKTIFLNALEIASSEARRAYLIGQCGHDQSLRAEVEELLRHHEQIGPYIESASVAETTPPPSIERPGTWIGPYKLLQQIGEGGMGTVYMAEQTEPVQRKVALKVIKPGMDSRQVVARFEAERQALAMMDHVNIARVFDAGATQSGRPYFVMELVHGVPITKYCDDNHLTPRERLELFVPVCHAIQHAHQKGIIHRDIKPSNVMVTLYDGKPVPKVIDFGVAKATEQKLTERTLFTQYGTMVGTLEYMSPEQAEMSALGVDTRSDIYSLGVLLYELLTGSTPLSSKRMKEVAYAEILRMIKEEEPPKPSTRLSDSGEALASISAQRHMEPAKLANLLRGELDWIVMKTLEKDRNRRYETANGFAADVQRYLADEPVQACPPSTAYRLRKFVRRNKGPVVAASVVALSLVGGMVGTTWGLVRAEVARKQAVQSQQAERERAEGERKAKQDALAAAAAEKVAKVTAEARETETKAVLDFVQSRIFVAARPEGYVGGLGREVTLRRAIEAALPFVEQGFTDQPLIESRLRLTLGTSFFYLGEFQVATDQYEIARAIRDKHLGPEHLDTISSMVTLATGYSALGRDAEAVKLHEETFALRKAKLGTDHRDTLVSMSSLGVAYNALGRHAEAVKLDEETLALRKAKLGLDHPDTLLTMSNLAAHYKPLGRQAESLKLNEETFALRKAKLGPDHADTVWTMNNLAGSYRHFGRHAEAIELNEVAAAYMKAKRGPDHPNTLLTMASLGASYDAAGRLDDALKIREEVFALRKAKLGPDHPDTLASMYDLAANYYHLGRVADALPLDEALLNSRRAKLGPDHPNTLQTMQTLSADYAAVGRHADALKVREDLLALHKVKSGPDSANTLRTLQRVAESLVKLNRGTEAVRMAREAAQTLEDLNPADSGKLYLAAELRAVTAAIICASHESENAATESVAEADRAMVWLKQAVAAGYKNTADLKRSTYLSALRDRDDFKELLAQMEATVREASEALKK